MQLFQDNNFFILLAVFSIPALIMGYFEKPLRIYGFSVSLVFLWLVMGGTHRALVYLAVFLLWEIVEAKIYLKVRKKYGRNRKLYYLFLILSLYR